LTRASNTRKAVKSWLVDHHRSSLKVSARSLCAFSKDPIADATGVLI
jgi:hypothetical protein